MKKKSVKISYDPLTQQIQKLLLKIPHLGESVARLYLWRAMMFNFMIVGSSGVIMQWFLYEGFFRILFLAIWGGTFIAMIITTTVVFLWNYELNKRWSLNSTAQVMGMKKPELQKLRLTIDRLLREKFNDDGSRA